MAFDRLTQTEKLLQYGQALPRLDQIPNGYIVINVADVDLEKRLPARWNWFPRSILDELRTAVFHASLGFQVSGTPLTYVYALDLAEPPADTPPGTRSVNPRYGVHLNLALYLPDDLLPRLIDVLLRIARRTHKRAAISRGLPVWQPTRKQVTIEGRGIAAFYKPTDPARGGPVGLVSGYFVKRLKRLLRLAPFRGLQLPATRKFQLIGASADVRAAARDLHDERRVAALASSRPAVPAPRQPQPGDAEILAWVNDDRYPVWGQPDLDEQIAAASQDEPGIIGCAFHRLSFPIDGSIPAKIFTWPPVALERPVSAAGFRPPIHTASDTLARAGASTPSQ